MATLSISSPVGNLVLEDRDGAITAIRWSSGSSGGGSLLLAEAARQLDAYFAGKLSVFDLPIQPAGSAFERRVWTAMLRIPYGQTRTYGELAMNISSVARAVGGACGKNPIPIVVPCHRVLGKTNLGGYSGSGGLKTKRLLLGLEGASPQAEPLAAE